MHVVRVARQNFRKFLQKMGKKGFLDTLELIRDNKNIHYNEIQKYLLDKKILDGRASVPIILNGLVEMNFIERKVEVDTRPMRTQYSISKIGLQTFKTLQDLESELKSTL